MNLDRWDADKLYSSPQNTALKLKPKHGVDQAES